MAGWTPASGTADQPAPRVAPAGTAPSRGRLLPRWTLTIPGLLGLGLTALFACVALAAPWLAPHDPFTPVGPSLHGPSAAHPIGTDALGRDLLSGVIHGARTSFVVVAGTGVVVLAVAILVGATAGYRGGRPDDVLMRVTEMFQVLPRFFLAIVVIAMFGPGIDRLIVVLGLTSWPLLARVVRAEVLSLREREFVEASVMAGAHPWRILVRTILPNAMPATVVYLALLLAQVLLLEASLGFIGLGDPNAMSWGYLAGQAQRFLRTAWWLSFFPGLAIVLAVVGLNLLGDSITASGGRPRPVRARRS